MIYVVIFFIGIIARYIGSFVSSGVSVLNIGILTLIGISPQMANITFKLAKIGDNFGGFLLLRKHGHIPYGFVIPSSCVLLIGSFLGSRSLVQLSDAWIFLGSGLSVLLLLIVSLFRKIKLEKNEDTSRIRKIFGFIAQFFASLIGNLFPAGSGMWYYFINTLIFRLTPIQSKGLSSILSFSWSIGTTIGIFSTGVYDIGFAVSLCLGMFFGGYFGTKHVIRIGNHTLDRLIRISMFFFAFFFLFQGFQALNI
ncbi:sulfite exporter TauE/SafE family protein [Candidatus Gracilibacteria bacterium]|nr:sulfite exporter TauE/SafE family protein [Candidatus Gracilibacteria bacterium]